MTSKTKKTERKEAEVTVATGVSQLEASLQCDRRIVARLGGVPGRDQAPEDPGQDQGQPRYRAERIRDPLPNDEDRDHLRDRGNRIAVAVVGGTTGEEMIKNATHDENLLGARQGVQVMRSQVLRWDETMLR